MGRGCVRQGIWIRVGCWICNGLIAQDLKSGVDLEYRANIGLCVDNQFSPNLLNDAADNRKS